MPGSHEPTSLFQASERRGEHVWRSAICLVGIVLILAESPLWAQAKKPPAKPAEKTFEDVTLDTKDGVIIQMHVLSGPREEDDGTVDPAARLERKPHGTALAGDVPAAVAGARRDRPRFARTRHKRSATRVGDGRSTVRR